MDNRPDGHPPSRYPRRDRRTWPGRWAMRLLDELGPKIRQLQVLQWWNHYHRVEAVRAAACEEAPTHLTRMDGMYRDATP
jgi:hypothetical protein